MNFKKSQLLVCSRTACFHLLQQLVNALLLLEICWSLRSLLGHLRVCQVRPANWRFRTTLWFSRMFIEQKPFLILTLLLVLHSLLQHSFDLPQLWIYLWQLSLYSDSHPGVDYMLLCEQIQSGIKFKWSKVGLGKLYRLVAVYKNSIQINKMAEMPT